VSAGSAKVCFRIKVFFSFLNIKFLKNYLLGKLSLSCFFQVYWSKSAIITARCYAPAVLAMALCPSVRPSVCRSQVGVLLKRLNVGSHKQHHTIAQGL